MIFWHIMNTPLIRESVLPVWFLMWRRSKSPLDKCAIPKSLTMRLDIVPFPEPGGPIIMALKTLEIIVFLIELNKINNHSIIIEINTITGQWKQWFIFDKGHIVIATIKSDRLWQHHWMINVARTYTTQQTCFFIFIFPHLRTN